ncbi:serpin B [Amycolatopsis arida]|uniref:Serpin B n=1 Tax=Amycolatopsis arida TaxID=587909 RepID=A0A1I5V2K7_9PSEU|nr:serpin family protein [Amycolatopsis arida]TDX91107.1 serpin B [Amycolatopsis arida]SFQ01186.1 serpin B [Amycolatopsis arida]
MADREPEHAHLSFALALHRSVAGAAGDSCLSPYSVASALTLAARAARGDTAGELAHLLAGSPAGLPEQAALLRAAAELAEPAERQEEPVLAVANTLWAWEKLPIRDEFRAELAGWVGGRVATAPFAEDPEGARRIINDDIDRATHGLVPELLTPGTVRDDTVAALVNALYLRTAWVFPFPESDTAEADFTAPDGVRRVPTMYQVERLGYAADAGWQVVSLPAVGGVQAVVLLPDGDLADREPGLDADTLGRLLAGTRERLVHLWLPRIRLDLRSELTRPLRALGVRTMFTSAADFGGLTDDPRLLVSDVLHQAVLRLDERGLEGAAATAVMMRLVMMPEGDPVEVRVDRPFLLLVRHAMTGAVYFLARITRP